MNGPVRAMIWELYRTGRMEVVARLGYAMLLAGAIAGISGRAGENVPLAARGLIVLLSSIAAVGSIVWIRELDRSNAGFSFRLGFARPVRTFDLVTVPLVFTVLLALICYLIPVALFWIIGNVAMPILAPLALVVCTTVCCTGMAWGTRTIADRALGLIAVLTSLSLAIVAMHEQSGSEEPFLLAIGNPDYYRVGWLFYGTITLITAIAFLLTLKSVSLQRQGAGFELSTTVGSLLRSGSAGKLASRPFRNRITAQFAYEFRNCSTMTLLFGLAGPVAVYLIVRFSLWINPERIHTTTVFEGAPVLWMIALVLSPAVYQLVATDAALGLRSRTGTHRFSAYDATRPMTNGQLAVIKLTAVAACSFVAWVPMWCGSMLYAGFGGDGNIPGQLSTALESLELSPWLFWPAATCCVLLLYVAGSCMLLTFGLWMPLYARRFVAFCCFCYAHFALAFCGTRFEWGLAPFWKAYGFVAAAVVVLLAVRTIARALRHGAISARVFCAILAAWLVLVGSITAVIGTTGLIQQVPLAAAVFGASLLFVLLAAPAAAPMAIHAQRHQ